MVKTEEKILCLLSNKLQHATLIERGTMFKIEEEAGKIDLLRNAWCDALHHTMHFSSLRFPIRGYNSVFEEAFYFESSDIFSFVKSSTPEKKVVCSCEVNFFHVFCIVYVCF